jgi:hypothetical protein
METRRHPEYCDDCINKAYTELADLTKIELTDEELDIELLKMELDYAKYL